MKNLIFNIYKTLFFFDLAVIIIYVIPDIKNENPAILKLWQEAVPFAIMVVFTLIFLKLVERGKLKVPVFEKPFKNAIIGLFFGILLITLPVAVMWGLKIFTVTGQNKVSTVALWVLAVFFNAATQELLLHGYLYRLYKSFYRTIAAVIITTLLYISLNIEIFNKGIIVIANMLLFNVFLCMLFDYTKTLLAPIIAHFVFNTLLTIALGGSWLNIDYPNLLNCSYTGKKYLSGGEAGPEGSVILLVVTFLFTLFLFYKNRKRYLKNKPNR